MPRGRFLYLLPTLLAFTLAIVAPVFIMGATSLFDTNFIFTKFVGFGNYIAIFQDARFWQAAANTGLYIMVMVPLGTFLPLWAALTAHGMSKRMQNTLRFGLYLPVLASGIVLAGTWRMLFDYRKGLVNWILGLVGISPVAWWMQRATALPLIALIITFTIWMGGMAAMYMAVLNAIPAELYEAAKADGATRGQLQRYVLIPSISPSIGFVMLLTLINTVNFWEHIFLLTGGGPDGQTANLAFDIFTSAFSYGKYGMASAKSLVLYLIVLGLALGRERIQRSFV